MSIQFNFTYGSDVTLQQMVGVEAAGKIWSSYLQDDVTINIHIGTSSSLPKDVIGGALPGIKADIDHGTFYSALKADQTTANDATAVQNLFRFSSRAVYDMFINGDNNFGSSHSIDDLNVTRANAKALNLIDRHDQGIDGVILFGSLAGNNKYNWNYDYSRSGNMKGKDLDYLSTAMHEIGHVLGFISGVDQPGWISSRVDHSQGNTLLAYRDFLEERASFATSLDLYRYKIELDEYGWLDSDIDLSYGSDGSKKYFSIDGQTVLAEFSTGLDTSLGGDGEQASHWKHKTEGLFAPRLKKKQRANITTLDLTAFDVIGWDTTSKSINFDQIHNQAKRTLAAKINPNLAFSQRLSWINNVLSDTSTANSYAAQISQEPTQAINSMIDNSQVYEWGTAGDGYWWGADSDGWWQKVANLFYQRGLFSTVSEGETLSETTVDNLSPTGFITELFNHPDLTIQWNNTPAQNSDPSSDNVTAIQVQSGNIQLMLVQEIPFDLNTPKSFSLNSVIIASSTHKPQPDRETDLEIMGDGHRDIGT